MLRSLFSEFLISSRAFVNASRDRSRSIAMRAMSPAATINSSSRSLGIRGSAYEIQNVARTSPSPEMSGSDQAAQTPLLKARFRTSSGHRGSLETSVIITRCFVKAAVPQEPLLGPIGQGVIAAVYAAGTRGAAHGNNCFPSGSIKQTIEVAGGAWASIAAHKSVSTSERLAPFAIISSVRLSAANRGSARNEAVVLGPCLQSDSASWTVLAAPLHRTRWSCSRRDSSKPFKERVSEPIMPEYPPRAE